MSDRLQEMVAETRVAAANVEHVWDEKALDWSLSRDSVVVEVGGYKGRWALQIAERYSPRLYVFEPQPWAYEVCKAVLGKRATVLDYALGDRHDLIDMGEWETDGCSFVKAPSLDHQGFGELREIGIAFRELGIDHIDLMLMNIEGYEYTLIPHMLHMRIYPDVLMVQMHEFAGNSWPIYEQLEAHGYRVRWTYGVMLTAWERG